MVYYVFDSIHLCDAVVLWFHLRLFCSCPCPCPGPRPQPAVPAALQALPGLKTAIIKEF